MRLATITDDGRVVVALVDGRRVLPLAVPDDVSGIELGSLRGIAASGPDGLERIRRWAAGQPDAAYRSLDDVELGPAIPDPGAIYTIGLNYRSPAEPAGDSRPERPMVYGKLPSSVTGHGSTIAWDRALSPNVDAEVELGVVIGAAGAAVSPADAMAHVFGYTCVNDVSSRDPWLDGDQWLLGKSMAGFCPVGPWVVTPDEISPDDLELGCTINGVAIQAGSTAQLRFSIAEVIAYLSRHVTLQPGDLIATGTPARLAGPMGADRHLEAGDEVTVWIEHLGELTTTIA
jgi:2-keto-4-pentenoate hydratase/2-oxohepta-3-ene-1,7-dioic acid hydratase in catechol pathway